MILNPLYATALLVSTYFASTQVALAAPTSRSLVKRSDFSKSSGPIFRFTGGVGDISSMAEQIRQYKDLGAGKLDRVQIIGWADENPGTLGQEYDTITDKNEPEKMDQNMFDGVNVELTFTRVDVAKFKAENKLWAYRLFYVTIPAAALGGGDNYGTEDLTSQRMPMEWWG